MTVENAGFESVAHQYMYVERVKTNLESLLVKFYIRSEDWGLTGTVKDGVLEIGI